MNDFEKQQNEMVAGATKLLKKVPAGVLLINQHHIDGDTPRLRALNGHEVIVYKGFDLWDASKSRFSPKFVKPNATEDEAIDWLKLR